MFFLINVHISITFQVAGEVHKPVSVVNLSSVELTPAQISILNTGLTFCPTPGASDPAICRIDLHTFHRSLKLRTYFNHPDQDSPEKDVVSDLDNLSTLSEDNMSFSDRKFAPRSTCTPPGPIGLEIICLINELNLPSYLNSKPRYHNISQSERQSLYELRNDTSITIKKAKGGAIVIMNTSDYIKEELRQLSNQNYYHAILENYTSKHMKLIQSRLQYLPTR